jgi:CheY-like chemotaxis protein
MPGEEVLVIDDNAVNLRLLSVLLRAEGFVVRTASSADEAGRRLAASTPRLILMDIQLPDVDGLTLTRRLKADPRTSAIPIVAVTSYAMRGDEEKARAAGCDGYISKPIDTRALPGLVRAALTPPRA